MRANGSASRQVPSVSVRGASLRCLGARVPGKSASLANHRASLPFTLPRSSSLLNCCGYDYGSCVDNPLSLFLMLVLSPSTVTDGCSVCVCEENDPLFSQQTSSAPDTVRLCMCSHLTLYSHSPSPSRGLCIGFTAAASLTSQSLWSQVLALAATVVAAATEF